MTASSRLKAEGSLGWKTAKVGKLCNVVTGGTPSTQHPEFYGGNISWLKSGDIKGNYVSDTPEKLTLEGVRNSNAKVHPAGGVAIALSGRGQTRGRTVVIKKPMACSQSVAIMLPYESISPEFLHYSLAAKYSEIRNLTGDNDRSGLNLKLVSNLCIPLPPLPEQHRIATILTTVDDAIQRSRQAVAETERLKAGVMHELMTKGIRHTEFRDDPDVGKVPKKWNISELKDIVDINPESRDPAQNPFENFSYIDIDSVENGSGVITSIKDLIGKNAPSRARRVVHTDDVIMSEVRPYLKAFALVPKKLNNQICSTGFAVLRSKGEIDPKYLLDILFSNGVIEQCNRMMVGAQYPALNDSQVKKIRIPLPPITEQLRIATILSNIDRKLTLQRQRTANYEKLKQGLMNELLTGKRRVKVT